MAEYASEGLEIEDVELRKLNAEVVSIRSHLPIDDENLLLPSTLSLQVRTNSSFGRNLSARQNHWKEA